MGQGNSSQTPVVTQCFGLPGEPLCNHVFHGPRHRAVMRNPRDVIFNFETGNGATYKLHSPHDYFYDVKNKRRVKEMTFKDGQMTHIWVDRFFKGNLELHHGNKIIARYNIAKLAQHSGAKEPSTNPKEKPLPIIIGAGKNNSEQYFGLGNGPIPQPRDILSGIIPPSSESSSIAQGMYVVEVTEISIPHHLITKTINSKKQEITVSKSDLTVGGAISGAMPYFQMATGLGGYLWDGRKWIPEVLSTKFRLTRNSGKYYMIFAGDASSRTYLTGTRYGIRNPKIVNIVGGAGNPKIMGGIAEEMEGQFRGAGGFLTAFWTGVDIGNWYEGYNDVHLGEDGNLVRGSDFADLGGILAYDAIGIGVGAVATWGAKSLAIYAFGTAAEAIAFFGGGWIVVGSIALVVGIGFGLYEAEKHWHIVEHLSLGFRKAAKYLEGRSPTDYNGYSQTFVLQNR